jgi:hypothetical protein
MCNQIIRDGKNHACWCKTRQDYSERQKYTHYKEKFKNKWLFQIKEESGKGNIKIFDEKFSLIITYEIRKGKILSL